MTGVSAPFAIQSSLLCDLNTSKEPSDKVPSPTTWKQPFAHLPGYQVATSCSLLGHLSLPKFLGFWPNAVHLPSPGGKHSFTVSATHRHSISPLWTGGRGRRGSPEMFPWNHEPQGWGISHLKNSAMQTSPPVTQSPGLRGQAHHPAPPPGSH